MTTMNTTELLKQTEPWTVRYAPTVLDDLILTDKLKPVFENIIKTKKLTNLSLFGTPGIGKTTLAKILVNSLGAEHIIHPCSMDGSVDTIKSKIVGFCRIVPRNSYKVIILDEADQLSNTAQLSLRNIIQEYEAHTRFILTANNEAGIIDAIKSRCTDYKLKAQPQDVLKRCVNILNNEHINYTRESLKDFYKTVIETKFPDVRACISCLQLMSESGTLTVYDVEETIPFEELTDYIYSGLKTKPINELRAYWLSNEGKFGKKYPDLTKALFNRFSDNSEAMLLISNYLWRMSFQLDKEIQFTGMILELKGLV